MKAWETTGEIALKFIVEEWEYSFKKTIQYFFKNKRKMTTSTQNFDKHGDNKL